MAIKDTGINIEGINGTGQGIVNINSQDYKDLQKAILEHAQNQTDEEKITYHLLSLKYQIIC